MNLFLNQAISPKTYLTNFHWNVRLGDLSEGDSLKLNLTFLIVVDVQRQRKEMIKTLLKKH